MKTILTDLKELETPASPVIFITDTGLDDSEAKEIVDDLKATMTEDPSILALSAKQIGVNKRVFGIRFNDIIKIFINPIIKRKKGNLIGVETFNSAPGKEYLVARPEEVTIAYYNEELKYEDNKLLGYAARIFTQQAELLDGVLPGEIGLESDIETDGHFADLSDAEQKEAIDIYTKITELRNAQAKAAIEANPELSKDYKLLKFTEEVINDRTQVLNYNPTNRQQRRAAKYGESKVPKARRKQ